MTQQIHDSAAGQPMVPGESALVRRAHNSALENFSGVSRKVPRNSDFLPEPYSNHLERVAAILKSLGYSDPAIAAAYLHDHTEDLEDWDGERIANEFGADVAELVRCVSYDDTSRPWLERRDELRAKLLEAPVEALAIACADQLDNIASTNRWLKRGFQVEDLMDHSFREYLLWYRRYGAIFKQHLPAELYQQFEAALDEYDNLGSGADLG